MLEKIKDILNNSKKPHNSLKPLQKELENFKNTIYPDLKLTLIEIAYNFINRDEGIICSICNKNKKKLKSGFAARVVVFVRLTMPRQEHGK